MFSCQMERGQLNYKTIERCIKNDTEKIVFIVIGTRIQGVTRYPLMRTYFKLLEVCNPKPNPQNPITLGLKISGCIMYDGVLPLGA